MDDAGVSGTATFPKKQPTTFKANAAIGVSGVYWADGTEGFRVCLMIVLALNDEQ